MKKKDAQISKLKSELDEKRKILETLNKQNKEYVTTLGSVGTTISRVARLIDNVNTVQSELIKISKTFESEEINEILANAEAKVANMVDKAERGASDVESNSASNVVSEGASDEEGEKNGKGK